MRRLALLLFLTALGCRPGPAPVAPAPTAPPATRVPAPEPEPPPPASGAPVMLEGASLRGDPLRLHHDGTLTLGAARVTVEFETPDSFWIEQQASLRELDLGEGTTVVLLELPLPEQEDPPNRVQAFVPEADTLRPVWDWTPSGYGPVPIEAPGEGTLQYTQDGWTACIEAGHPTTPVRLMVVTLTLQGEPPMFIETGREPSDELQRCDQLAG